MKVKVSSFLLAILLFTSIQVVFPQEIWFEAPSNGQVIANTSAGSETKITISYIVKGKGFISSWYPHNAYARIYDQNWTLLGGSSLTLNNYTDIFQVSGSFELAPGTNKLYATLQEEHDVGSWYTTASTTIDIYVKHTISICNNIPAGSINVDGANLNNGTPIYKYTGDLISLGAIDQPSRGYNYTWNTGNTNPSRWKRQSMLGNQGYIYGATTRNFSYTVASNDNGATITSDLRKILSITVQNNMVGLGSIGVINVNGTQYNSSYSGNAIEGDQIAATAINQTINGITYSFSHWSDGTTPQTQTFSPNEHTTYTAYFTGKPSNENRNLSALGAPNQPVILTWTDNPNPNVTQYQIWRNVKQKDGTITTSMIATVNRGVQTYTDYEYWGTSTYTNDLLRYDVRAYYSVENSYADTWYQVVLYGKLALKYNEEISSSLEKANEIERITDYSTSCYPNPFNPVTTINYQLPEDGFVTLKVYDALGREVKTLVNEYKNKGAFKVMFNASALPSGAYIYQMKANNFVSTKKMLLIK